MKRPTASRLALAERCSVAFALPWADEPSPASASGTAMHAFLAAVPTLGRERALAAVPAEHRERCEALDLEALPLDRARYAAEVAFAYEAETGRARELGRGIGRCYRDLDDDEIPGTADVVAIGPDFVLVDEYGGRSKARAEGNLQAQFYGLCAARAYDRSRAVVRVTKLLEDGEPYRSEVTLGPIELTNLELRIAAIVRGIAKARTAAPAELRPTIGDWCTYCPALRSCPAHTAALALFAGGFARAARSSDEGLVERLAAELSPDRVRELWPQVKVARRALGLAEQAMLLVAGQAPIDLGDGLVLGQYEKRRESVTDGGAVYDLLRERFGVDVARSACEIKSSKSAIRDVARDFRLRGVTIKAATEALLTELRELGAVQTKTTVTVCEHRAGE